MYRGLAVAVQQLFSDAVIAGIVGIDDLAIAVGVPGQITGAVIVRLTDLVIAVVILVADSAVTGGKHGGLAVGIQVFAQDEALAVIPGIAHGGVTAGTVDGHILVIQVGFRQDGAVLIHRTQDAGIAGADVRALILIIQVDDADKVQILIVDELRSGIAILEQGGLAGDIQVSGAPYLALIAVLITDSSVAVGDHGGEAVEVQVCLADTAILVIIGVDNGSEAELALHRLQAGIQILQAYQVAAGIVRTAGSRYARGQGGYALVLIQILFEDDVVIRIVFALPYAEAFRHAGQIILLIQVADLQDVVGVVVNAGNRRIALPGGHTGHIGIQVGDLGETAAGIVFAVCSGIAILTHHDIIIVIPYAADAVVRLIIGVQHTVVAFRHLGGLAFKYVPSLLRAVVMGIILVGHVAVAALLQDVPAILAEIRLAGQIAVAVPGLDLTGVTGDLRDQRAAPVGILFRKQAAGSIIRAGLQGIALGRDHRLAIRAEVYLGKHVSESIIRIGNGGIIAAIAVGSAALIEEALAHEAALLIVFTHDLSSAGDDIGYSAIRSVMDFPYQVALMVILADEGGVSIRALRRAAVFIKVVFRQLMAFTVPGVGDAVVTIGNRNGLALRAEVGNAESLAAEILHRFAGGIAEGGHDRLPVGTEIGDGGLIAIVGIAHNGVAIRIHKESAIGIVISFFRDAVIIVHLALKPGIAGRRRRDGSAALIVIGAAQEVADRIILCLIGGIALRQQRGLAIGIQVIHAGGDAALRIVGKTPGGIAAAQEDRLPVSAKVDLVDHVVGIVIFTLHNGAPANQGRLILAVEPGDTGDIALHIIGIDDGSIAGSVRYRCAFRIVILFSGVVAGIIISMYLYGVRAVGDHGAAILAQGRLPEEAAAAVIFTQHCGFARTDSAGRAIGIVIPRRSLAELSIIIIDNAVRAVHNACIGTAVGFPEGFLQEKIFLRAAIDHCAGISAVDALAGIAVLVEILLAYRRLIRTVPRIGEIDIGVLAFIIAGGLPVITHVHRPHDLMVFIAGVQDARVACLALDQLHIRAEGALPLDRIGIQDPQFIAGFIIAERTVVQPFDTGIAGIDHGVLIQDIVIGFPVIEIPAVVLHLHHGIAVGGHRALTVRTKIADVVDTVVTIILIGHFRVTIEHLDKPAVTAEVIDLYDAVLLIIGVDHGSIAGSAHDGLILRIVKIDTDEVPALVIGADLTVPMVGAEDLAAIRAVDLCRDQHGTAASIHLAGAEIHSVCAGRRIDLHAKAHIVYTRVHCRGNTLGIRKDDCRAAFRAQQGRAVRCLVFLGDHDGVLILFYGGEDLRISAGRLDRIIIRIEIICAYDPGPIPCIAAIAIAAGDIRTAAVSGIAILLDQMRYTVRAVHIGELCAGIAAIRIHRLAVQAEIRLRQRISLIIIGVFRTVKAAGIDRRRAVQITRRLADQVPRLVPDAIRLGKGRQTQRGPFCTCTYCDTHRQQEKEQYQHRSFEHSHHKALLNTHTYRLWVVLFSFFQFILLKHVCGISPAFHALQPRSVTWYRIYGSIYTHDSICGCSRSPDAASRRRRRSRADPDPSSPLR